MSQIPLGDEVEKAAHNLYRLDQMKMCKKVFFQKYDIIVKNGQAQFFKMCIF